MRTTAATAAEANFPGWPRDAELRPSAPSTAAKLVEDDVGVVTAGPESAPCCWLTILVFGASATSADTSTASNPPAGVFVRRS